MISFTLFLAAALATHRLTVLFIDDIIFEKPRNALFDKWNPANSWTYVFTCPWCMSIWSALIVVLLLLIPFGWLLILLLAFSSITALIEERRA